MSVAGAAHRRGVERRDVGVTTVWSAEGMEEKVIEGSKSFATTTVDNHACPPFSPSVECNEFLARIIFVLEDTFRHQSRSKQEVTGCYRIN
jgi:hypothetical protein